MNVMPTACALCPVELQGAYRILEHDIEQRAGPSPSVFSQDPTQGQSPSEFIPAK
jgi:hypothetical protein